MNTHLAEYRQKQQSAEDAVKLVHSGDRVFIGAASSIAYALVDALWARRAELTDVELAVSNIMKPTPICTHAAESPFTITSPFLGPGERSAAKNGGQVNYTSFHLSEVDLWLRDVARPTVAFFEVSTPDENGYMSYGPSGGSLYTYAKESAERIVVQVNRNTPHVTGQHCTIHISEVDALVEADCPLSTLTEGEIDEVTQRISEGILELVPDGATVQLGIGKLSTAIGYGLQRYNDLGIHSELFNEPLMHLIRNGNVTNARKGFLDGLSVFAFAMGSEDMYSFMDHNPALYCGTFPFVNDPVNIARNRSMISINSAMAIDLYGQIAADSIGRKQQSAVGGQLDFVKGAQRSEGGRSIIATASSYFKDGVRKSKIMLEFPVGTAVTTPRSEVQYVATEYGCINLKGLNMSDRVRAMIRLAHPDFRAQLTDDAKQFKLI